MTLLVAAGLLVSSFLRLEQVSTGFVAKNVATFEVILPLGHYKEPAQRVAAFQAMQTGLQSLPGVVAVGAASSVPFTGRRPGSSLRVVGRPVVPNQPQPMLRAVRCLPGYFESMAIPLRHGRLFAASDTPDYNARVRITSAAPAARHG